MLNIICEVLIAKRYRLKQEKYTNRTDHWNLKEDIWGWLNPVRKYVVGASCAGESTLPHTQAQRLQDAAAMLKYEMDKWYVYTICDEIGYVLQYLLVVRLKDRDALIGWGVIWSDKPQMGK